MSEFAAVEAATTYDDALKAFLEVPESHEESPDHAPAVTSTTEVPAVVPAATQPAQTPAQPSAEEVQATVERDAELDRPVPATDAYPKMFHGRPMRQLLESFAEKERYITETRNQLQTKNDELIAAQATARVLAGQLQQRNQPAATVPPPAAPGKDVDEFYKGLGMADPFRAFTENPEAFFAQVARGAQAAAVAEIREEMGGRFAPLEKVVGEAHVNQQVGVARNAVDRAFDQIVEQDKVTDPQIRTAMRQRFDRLFSHNKAALATYVCQTSDATKPESWVSAYREQEQAIGGFAPLLSVAAASALPTGTKANPPSSARAGASVAGGQRTATGRRSAAAVSLLADSGFSEEDRAKYGDLISAEIEGLLGSGTISK